MELEIL